MNLHNESMIPVNILNKFLTHHNSDGTNCGKSI